MTQIAATPPLTGSVTVEVPIERAFRVFYGIDVGVVVDGEALRKGISEDGGGWGTLLELFAQTALNH